MKHLFLISFTFLGLFNAEAQVSIGDRPTPDSAAILDLRNTSDLGLLLPTATVNPGALDDADVIPLGMLYYYEGNLFLKDSINTGSPTDDFTGVTPWKSIFTGAKPVDVYFNPSDWDDYDPSSPVSSSKWGVGIGLSSGVKGNLHIALKNKDVNAGNTQSPLLIGDSDADIHMELDNDEILVKTNQNTPGTLKLQEGGGTVQVGDATIAPYTVSANRSTLNVIGEIQQHGFALVPKNGIIMWTGTVAPPGWALCNGGAITYLDGSTGTAPDLRERFIVGAMGENTTDAVTGTAYPVGIGTDAGRNSIAHTHDVDPLSFTTAGTEGAHAHSGTTAGGSGRIEKTTTCCDRDWVARDNHTHTFSTAGTQGAHVHNINVPNTESTGASNTENRPPYYALAFIMKL